MPESTMSYDPTLVAEVMSSVSDAYLFVGEDEAAQLTKNVNAQVTVEVISFPTDAELNKPTRWKFSGTLLSYPLTDNGTKGRFIFTDGTIIFLNTSLLK